MLYSLQQRDFYTVRAYTRRIEEIVTKLVILSGWSEAMRTEKIQEIFYCGLDETVKFEMTKLPNKNFCSVVTTLTEMEFLLIERLYREEQLHPSKHFDNDRLNQKHHNQMPRDKYKKPNRQTKFWSYHKFYSDNTSECRAIHKKKLDHSRRRSEITNLSPSTKLSQNQELLRSR
ncbi:hypothetical protein DMUE_4103 [Dictyocoela muelleri]|nr:hypothetical protein DMUE_4103 [Dictyocoela muelleri]